MALKATLFIVLKDLSQKGICATSREILKFWRWSKSIFVYFITDPKVEEARNEIFILEKDESDDIVKEIWKDTLLSNLFIFCILIFMSYTYIEESLNEWQKVIFFMSAPL